jgi:hypothetical protein
MTEVGKAANIANIIDITLPCLGGKALESNASSRTKTITQGHQSADFSHTQAPTTTKQGRIASNHRTKSINYIDLLPMQPDLQAREEPLINMEEYSNERNRT